jgi:hypothetical protein
MEGQQQTPKLLDQVRNILRLHHYLEGVKGYHEKDLAEGNGAVYLPCALERKYPGAARDWSWQYL